MTYDSSNIFAKILRGEIPSHKVYEDADAIVFMDVMPQSPGHALVVPKAASRNLLDADPAVLAKIIPLGAESRRGRKDRVQRRRASASRNSTSQPAARQSSICISTLCHATKASRCRCTRARWKMPPFSPPMREKLKAALAS